MSSNFLSVYNNIISPKLKSIDIAIKCCDNSIDINNISCLLDISEQEVIHILKLKNIHSISSKDIPVIMLNGSSYICKIFRKTLNIGCPKIYTAYDISYIYNFNYNDVTKICHRLNKSKFTSEELPMLFKYISL